MKNNWGWGGGLNREGGLINFLPLKRGGLLEGGGLFERGGLTEDLRYICPSGTGEQRFLALGSLKFYSSSFQLVLFSFFMVMLHIYTVKYMFLNFSTQ